MDEREIGKWGVVVSAMSRNDNGILFRIHSESHGASLGVTSILNDGEGLLLELFANLA